METGSPTTTERRPADDGAGDGLEELLFHAALLAGHGAAARSLAAAAVRGDAPEGTAAAGVRTCIDGGHPAMLSVLAPAQRALRLLQPVATAPDGALDRVCWQRTNYAGAAPAEQWLTESFRRGSDAGWGEALLLAQALKHEESFRRFHAAVGAYGRIFQLSRRLGGPPQGWVMWQLEHECSPAAVLAACGHAAAWEQAAPLITSLLDGPAASGGPWSIAWMPGEEHDRLRLGTTRWAWQYEDADKHRRFAQVCDQLGGDGRFAQALYRLLLGVRSANSFRSIGRAFEIELVDDRVQAVEWYLALPQLKAPHRAKGSSKESIHVVS